MSKELEQSMRMIFHQIENINKELEISKKTNKRMDILELKNTITESKKIIRRGLQHIFADKRKNSQTRRCFY